MKYFTSSLVALALALSMPTRCSAASYTVTDLGPGAGLGINSSGAVVGLSAHYFIYDGAMHDLGIAPHYDALNAGINDGGQIVGTTLDNFGGPVAFYYDGSVHVLGTLGGDHGSYGMAINNSGVVVGEASITGDSGVHAFAYNGAMHDLGTLPGFHTISQANGINANGQVTGYSNTAQSNIYHAFLFSSGTMHDIGTIGGNYSQGDAINATGRITGESTTPGDNFSHPFYYDGTMHDLGTLLGPNASATGHSINASGQIVGDSTNSEGGHAFADPFIYDTIHGMVDLNSLIDSSLGWTLNSATGINDRGQITGSAYRQDGVQHAVILSPVPEPSSFALAAGGLAGLVAWGLRRRRWPRCS